MIGRKPAADAGEVWCWGNDFLGQVGIGSAEAMIPAPLACAAGSGEGCLREEAFRLLTLGPEETACASRLHERLCAAGYQPACAFLPAAPQPREPSPP